MLRDCRPVAADDTSLTVGAPYNFHLEKLNDRTRLALLTEAVGEVAGSPRVVDITYVGEGTAPPKRPGGTGEATQAVLDTFAGSRVTSTRLRDDVDRPSAAALRRLPAQTAGDTDEQQHDEAAAADADRRWPSCRTSSAT